jgi:hypothetical protein
MNDPNELVRSLEADEIAALGPLPEPDAVTPTMDRDDRTPGSTADVHAAGVLTTSSSSYAVDEDDPFPPPRSMTEEQ